MLPKVVGLTPSIGICNKKVNLMRNKAFYKPILVITYRIGLETDAKVFRLTFDQISKK